MACRRLEIPVTNARFRAASLVAFTPLKASTTVSAACSRGYIMCDLMRDMYLTTPPNEKAIS